jgi:hypothetical protein
MLYLFQLHFIFAMEKPIMQSKVSLAQSSRQGTSRSSCKMMMPTRIAHATIISFDGSILNTCNYLHSATTFIL